MIPDYTKIHNRFRLNGMHYDLSGLKECAYSFIKEGDPFEKSMGDFLLDWLDDKDYLKVKTSGSTGRPKTIQAKKQALVNSAIATGDYFNLKPGNSALHCLPTAFIAGKMMFVRAIILGLELDLTKPSSNPLEHNKKTYDFCAMVPLQLENSVDKIQHIKKLIIGGAGVSDSLIKKIQTKRTKIYATYGMTETLTHIAVKKLNNMGNVTLSARLNDKVGQAVERSSFTVLPNIKISQDQRQCLVIEAPHLFEGELVTNDIVKIYSKSEFDVLGRIDHVINSGGVKLFPEQIENKLGSYIKNAFFIASETDKTLGEKLILIVEGEANLKDKVQTEIKKAKSLSKFEIPKTIYFVPKFIRTENGKIQRTKTKRKALK